MKTLNRHSRDYFKNEKKLERYGRNQLRQKYMRQVKNSLHEFNDMPVKHAYFYTVDAG